MCPQKAHPWTPTLRLRLAHPLHGEMTPTPKSAALIPFNSQNGVPGNLLRAPLNVPKVPQTYTSQRQLMSSSPALSFLLFQLTPPIYPTGDPDTYFLLAADPIPSKSWPFYFLNLLGACLPFSIPITTPLVQRTTISSLDQFRMVYLHLPSPKLFTEDTERFLNKVTAPSPGQCSPASPAPSLIWSSWGSCPSLTTTFLGLSPLILLPGLFPLPGILFSPLVVQLPSL